MSENSISIPTLLSSAVSELSSYRLEDLCPIKPENQPELLDLADSAIVRSVATAASNLLRAQPDDILHIAAAHSSNLLDYLAVRTLILGEEKPEDFDLGIF